MVMVRVMVRVRVRVRVRIQVACLSETRNSFSLERTFGVFVFCLLSLPSSFVVRLSVCLLSLSLVFCLLSLPSSFVFVFVFVFCLLSLPSSFVVCLCVCILSFSFVFCVLSFVFLSVVICLLRLCLSSLSLSLSMCPCRCVFVFTNVCLVSFVFVLVFVDLPLLEGEGPPLNVQKCQRLLQKISMGPYCGFVNVRRERWGERERES
jgi:hypothetical protein